MPIFTSAPAGKIQTSQSEKAIQRKIDKHTRLARACTGHEKEVHLAKVEKLQNGR